MAASSALIGWIISFTTVCLLIKALPIAVLLTTLAVSMILDNLSQIPFKADTCECPISLPTDDLPVGGVRLDTSDVVALGSTTAMTLALWA